MWFWQPAPQQLALEKHSIHVWRTSLVLSTAQRQTYLKLLDSNERARAARFHFDVHRNRYIASKAILRIILGRYLTIPPANICFTLGSHGKPYLSLECNKFNLQFNMSHSNDLAVYALTRSHEIGVDIEKVIDRSSEGISKRFFAREEYAALMQLPGKARKQAFFHIWTQKEAFIKAIGQGLSHALDKFIVSVTGPAELIRINNQPVEAKIWFMQDFFTQLGFCSALATRQSVDTIYYWNYAVE